MMAPVDIAGLVARSTAASMVPLRLEDLCAARVVAEAVKPQVQRPSITRQVAA